jgi:hypothetical protein
MMLTDDPWIAANSPIEPEKLHAIGVITYKWNTCEIGIRILLDCISNRNIDVTWTETHDIRSSQLMKRVEKTIVASHHKTHVKEAVLHAVKLYDVNRVNRNQLSHFLPGASKMGMEIRNNKTPDFSAIFDAPVVRSELSDIRLVAAEIQALITYLEGMINYFFAGVVNILEPRSLPEKPALPEFHWKPLPPSDRELACTRFC